MPFNFRKTSTMKLEKGNYGTSANAKSDQGKYEAKVKEFLGYCKDFNNALAKMGNNGKVKNVEDIRTCFNSSFKNYYQKTKKYSLFSHTTRVLKGMEKNLKKLAKKGDKGSEGSLTINGMAGDLKKAFDYKPKRSSDAEKGKRSAIDDRAVYGFFTATLPKTLTSLCKKAKGEAVAALRKQENTIDLIKESFSDLDELREKARKTVENAKRHSLHQGEQIEEVRAQNKGLRQTAKEQGTPGDQKAVGEQGDDIKELEEKREETNKKIKELNEKLKEKEAIYKNLSGFNINEYPGEWNVQGDSRAKQNLRKLLKIENNNETDEAKLIGKLNGKIKELNTDIEKIEEEAEKLEEKLVTIDINIEKIGNKQNKLEDKMEEDKKTQEQNFNLIDGTLTINGQDGLKAYYDAYVKNKDFYKNNTTNIVMNNVGDISEINAVNVGGLFSYFKDLTSVTAKGLEGTISKNAFNQCYKLSSFNSTNNNFYSIPASVGTIGDSAFAEAGSGVASGFSASIGSKTIGGGAFAGSSLKEVNLPHATIIEDDAFSECNSLATVTLGGNNIVIGTFAFSGTGLTEIDLTKVTTVKNSAFSGCESLAAVTLGSKTTIEDSVFYGCANLSKVTILKGRRIDGSVMQLKNKICEQAGKGEKTKENPNGIEFIIQ